MIIQQPLFLSKRSGSTELNKSLRQGCALERGLPDLLQTKLAKNEKGV